MISLVFLAACGVLVYTGFCRLVRTDAGTLFCVRAVFWLLPAAALLSIGAVLAYGHTPGWTDALLVISMAAVQVASSLLWRDGVPADYRSDQPIDPPPA